MERFVAFRDIGSSGRTTIDELDVPSETSRALKAAIAETCLDGQLKKSLSTHKFATVEVLDLRTGNACKLPHVLFSLHSSTSSMDQQFIPIRDTSGSALHPNRDLALQRAVLEFVERQSLTAMWAAKRCQASFVLQPSDVFNPGMKALTQRLTTRGRLVCHDISFLKGAHAFFVAYKARSETDFVQFACGASAALSWQAALAKALIEVWQSVLLPQMAFFDSTEYGGSDFKDDFQKANRQDFELDLDVIPSSVPGSDREGSLDEIKRSIFEITDSLFDFTQSQYVDLCKLTFCKVFSPDFFIHMNPVAGNNNSNAWIQTVAMGRPLRLTAMPFS